MNNLLNFLTGGELFTGVNNSGGHALRMKFVERLYCKRRILCLASSKILNPLPPHRLAIVYRRLWCGVRTHSLGGKGYGVNILEDARYCSVLYIRKYFVMKLIAAACVHDTGVNFTAVLMIINERQSQFANTCAVLTKYKNSLFKIVGIIFRPIYGKNSAAE
jgi:hypothetical protein